MKDEVIKMLLIEKSKSCFNDFRNAILNNNVDEELKNRMPESYEYLHKILNDSIDNESAEIALMAIYSMAFSVAFEAGLECSKHLNEVHKAPNDDL